MHSRLCKFFETEDFAHNPVRKEKTSIIFLPVIIFGTPENFSMGDFHGFSTKKKGNK